MPPFFSVHSSRSRSACKASEAQIHIRLTLLPDLDVRSLSACKADPDSMSCFHSLSAYKPSEAQIQSRHELVGMHLSALMMRDTYEKGLSRDKEG
jgi:hypothetical protein